jgi:hypothetical protein
MLNSGATVSLSRPFGRYFNASTVLDLTDLQDNKAGHSDLVFVKASIFARFNKLSASISGQSSWRFYGSVRTRDDYVRIDLSRYF